ncbi:DUF2703 domain-containing protein [Bacillus sp. JCM 19034]|uniref:DUF2703 domain-containing protein n=1 Tax=Bacillus sp. JCM 19034 TaxID=1481928 RepID=UPI0022B1E78F|nr:DUF2703 domain-containing protein [Bacillus sp. JCM 19034]
MSRSGVSSCNTCMSVEDQVLQMVADLRPVLEKVNTVVQVKKTIVQSLNQAEELQFKASPSIRIDGLEVLPTQGDIFGLGERFWEWEGSLYNAPPTALIVDTILRAYANSEQTQNTTPFIYQTPEPLREYFTDSFEKNINDNCECS